MVGSLSEASGTRHADLKIEPVLFATCTLQSHATKHEQIA